MKVSKQNIVFAIITKSISYDYKEIFIQNYLTSIVNFQPKYCNFMLLIVN